MIITVTLGGTLRYRALAPHPLTDAQAAALSSAIIAALAGVDHTDLAAVDAVVKREMARAVPLSGRGAEAPRDIAHRP